MTNDRAVIFDMDGIIFDSERLVLECWEALAVKYQLEGMREAYYPCIGTNEAKTREIMEAYYGETFPYETFRQESSVLFHERIKRESLPVKKGVRELLEYLKEQNIPVGLASSTRLSVVTQELQHKAIAGSGSRLRHSGAGESKSAAIAPVAAISAVAALVCLERMILSRRRLIGVIIRIIPVKIYTVLTSILRTLGFLT